jgi:radical SAM superfamily enzyme YgiQ (UPF0313 family)
MKTLLINPFNTHIIKSNFPYEIDTERGLFPPLGILYIASFLNSRQRHRVSVLDMDAEKMNLVDLEKIINKKNPDIIGIYTTTFNLIDVFLMIQKIKEINSNIHIVLGGPHVNIYPAETMLNDNVDYIVLGEGEIVFSDLLDALEKKIDLGRIKGLVYRNGGEITKILPSEPVQGLDNLPFPDRTMTKFRLYHNILTDNFPSTSILTSRGCPYRCIFCYRPEWQKIIRFRSIDNVIAEIEECIFLGIKDILFYDEIFTFNKQRTFELCDMIIERRLKIHWSIRTRVDKVELGVLKKLKEAGCRIVQFGVESGDPKILSIFNKGISIAQIKEAFSLAKKVGIQTVAYFMIGAPAEKVENILNTIRFAKQLDADYAHFSITMPYPDTILYEMGLRSNIFKNDFWREFAVKPNNGSIFHFWEEYISTKELNRLLKFAYKSFYFRPYFIIKTLLKTVSLKILIKRIKMGIKLWKYVFV